MTNEEKKSNEIAAEYLCGHDRFEVTYEEMREAVMEMAEWKDQQFKEYLEKKKEILMDAYRSIEQDKDKGGTIWCNPICFLDEIINELFGE